MRTGAPGPLMRGVLFLIKDGQAIITIIIRSCTMEHAFLRYGWENAPAEPEHCVLQWEDEMSKEACNKESPELCQFIGLVQHLTQINKSDCSGETSPLGASLK